MINFSSYFRSFMTPRVIRGSAMAVFLLVGGVVLQSAVDRAQSVHAQSSAPMLTSGDPARLVAEAPKVSDVRLSPDGSHVVYSVSRGTVAENHYVTELLLQALDAGGAARGAPVRLDSSVTGTGASSYTPQWCPDGSCVTYFAAPPAASESKAGGSMVPVADAPPALMRYEIGSRRASPIPVRDTDSGAKTPDAGPSHTSRPRITRVGNDYQWSPKGRFIAFTAPLGNPKLDPRGGVHTTAQAIGRLPGANTGLFVLDVSTGAVEQLSPDALHVWSFNWAPDEHALAVAATPKGVYVSSCDLFVIDRTTHAVRPLVTQPGLDGKPTWSPDGRWVAFTSQFGFPTYYPVGWPAVVPAAGGAIVRLATGDDDPQLSPFAYIAPIFWMPDSRGFYYPARHHMTSRLIRADILAKRVAPVSEDEHHYDDNFSFSADGRRLAFTRESLTTPPELFVQPISNGAPRQLTRLAPDFPLTSLVRIDRVSWPSRDRKFTIHGMLLTPRSAWQSEGTSNRPTAPLPTLVFLQGGPSMVDAALSRGSANASMLALAARGYAVLAPNTRGRSGYGEAFQHGIRDGQSADRLPYEDLMAGVDELIRRGIADADRLGVYGHSYGASLTAYTITQTNRFRASVVWEGSSVDGRFTEAFSAVPGTLWEELARDLHGIRNPFDPIELARLVAESPAFNMDRVSTPTLLLYGATGNGGARNAVGFFGGLQRFKIPSEFLLYEEGHGFRRPAAVTDAYMRIGSWFDYWLRGLPYPDAERAREYDVWRAAQQAGRPALNRRP